jgi:hypothetical protein
LTRFRPHALFEQGYAVAINGAALVSLTASSTGLLEDVGTIAPGIGVFRNHGLAGSGRRLASRKFQTPQAGNGALIRLSKGGADGGAVRELCLNFRRKKQGAAGITTAAPHIAGQWGRGE